MSKIGRPPHPWLRLSDAALLYAAAVEDETKSPKREADRLVKAALRYQRTTKPIGRPRTNP